jgi:hypothetical protein
MKANRAIALLAVLGGIALLAGCSGSFAPTLPSPDPGTTGNFVDVTPGKAGITGADLPNNLTARNFTATINGEPSRVTSAQFLGSSTLPVFICFIIDATGSMGGEIAMVRDNVQAFAESFRGRPIIWGGVEYGDATPADGASPGFDSARTKFDAAQNLDGFKSWVAGLDASGGGDGAENPLDALMEVRNNTYGWTLPANAIRHFIVITDITAHQRGDGTTFCDYTLAEVTSAFSGYATVHEVGPDYAAGSVAALKAKAANGVVPAAEETLDDVDIRPLATATGGTFIDINDDWDLLDLDIAAAVDEAYRVGFVVPPGLESGDVVIHGTWPGGSATWTYDDVSFD